MFNLFKSKTGRRKVWEAKELHEVLDKITKAKTLDELISMQQSIDAGDAGLVLGGAFIMKATGIRFENLEKRVSELEKGGKNG